jgi:hypothetical protein
MEPLKSPNPELEPDKYLSLDEILASNDTEYHVIQAWGGKVRIVSLTAEDLVEWTEANEDKQKKRVAGCRLIIKSLVDAKGNRIGDERQIPQLMKKSVKQTEAVIEQILKLNGMKVKGGKTEAQENSKND